jgi:signal peptide peptidase SppA
MKTQMTTRAALATISRFWAIDFSQGSFLDAPQLESRLIDEDEYGLGPYCSMSNGVAFIEVVGVMMRNPPWWYSGACSTTEVQRAVRAAMNDPRCSKIVMVFDSPGGEVSGTPELADAINLARQVKPVQGYVTGLCCSAAYFVASQCEKITASPYSQIGSIGVYSVLYDASEMFKDAGIEVLVFTSGGVKGQGVFGTEISEEFKDECQASVMDSFEMFVTAIESGRKMDRKDVLSCADGRTWKAAVAEGKGLIDSIEGIDSFYAGAVRTGPGEARNTMANLFKKLGFGADPEPTKDAVNPLELGVVQQLVKVEITNVATTLLADQKITPAFENAVKQCLSEVIESEGVTLEADGSVKMGGGFAAVTKLLGELPDMKLDAPKIAVAGLVETPVEKKGDGGSEAYKASYEASKKGANN